MTHPKSVLTAALFAVVLVGGSSSAAFAGEVRGGPGTPGVPGSGSGVSTGAPEHSNSICSFSGLNDMVNGPIDAITQTPANQGPPGAPGHGTCAGGSNPQNPPTP